MRYRKTKNKIKFTWFFVADGRNVAHKVSSIEEGTRLGNSLISDTGGIADGNKLTHRGVSAIGAGDKPVVDEESMKEVANVCTNLLFSRCAISTDYLPKGELQERRRS